MFPPKAFFDFWKVGLAEIERRCSFESVNDFRDRKDWGVFQMKVDVISLKISLHDCECHRLRCSAPAFADAFEHPLSDWSFPVFRHKDQMAMEF